MNKVIWITGASSGLGRGIALELASLCKCKLVLSGLEEDWLEEVKKECLDLSNGALTPDDILLIPGDLTQNSMHEKWFDQILQTFGKFDILFNNAGMGVCGFVHNVRGHLERKLFEVNYFAMTSLARCVLPHMRKQRAGQIVFTASLFSTVVPPTLSGYCATKHAILAFANALRVENHLYGIRVTSLEPSAMDTRILTHPEGSSTPEKNFSVDLVNHPQVRRWHLSPTRAAQLALAAVANNAYGAWIMTFPYLVLFYVYFMSPSFILWLATAVNSRLVGKLIENPKQKQNIRHHD